MHPSDVGISRLFDQIRDAVIVADAASNRIVLWNPAAAALFGYSPAEAVGRPLEILVPERLRAQHRAGLAHYAATGRGALLDSGTPVELPALHQSGREIPIELSLSALETVDARRLVLAIVRDLTERQQAEAARAQAMEVELLLAREHAARAAAEAAVRARDEVLAAASHDLKTPLTAIRGQAQFLQRLVDRLDVVRSEPLQQGLASIDATVTRMTRLVDTLLDVTRLQMGDALPLDRQPTDLVALARRLGAEHQAADARRRIRVESAVPKLVGRWDAARLERVLDNLLSNAIKYSPPGSEVRIMVGRERNANGGAAVLTVQDAGIGIPVPDLPRVFEQFHRGGNVVGKIPGTGVGLVSAKQIVEQHGGRIAIASQEMNGTTVTVWLPLTFA